MNDMILSPMQQDDVTRGEFDGLKTLMNEGFEKSFEMSGTIEKKVDKNSEYVKDGFEKVFKQIDAVETNLGEKIDSFETKVNERFDKVEEKLGTVEEKVDSAIDQIKLLTKAVNNLIK